MDGMHISVPEAHGFLLWLKRRGGRGTGMAYTLEMRKLHINNGASSARRWLAGTGCPGALETERDAGAAIWTERNGNAVAYVAREDVLDAIDHGLIVHGSWQKARSVPQVQKTLF